MSGLYDRINKLCKTEKTNITAMCKELNIARSSLSELNAGRTKSLSSDYLQRISDRFNVSTKYLLTGEESDQKQNTPVQTEVLSVEDRVDQILSGMESEQTLMLDGKPMSPEAQEAFRNSLIVSVELARKMNKEKGHKKDENDRNQQQSQKNS